MMTSLSKRILSALVLFPVVIGAAMMGGLYFHALLIVAIVICGYEWFGLSWAIKQNNHGPFRFLPMFSALSALALLPLAFESAYQLRMGDENGIVRLLVPLTAIWASDIGAYITGKSIGGPKLWPSVSPNKTWTGLVGGAVSSCIVFILYYHCLDQPLNSMTALGPYIWAGFGFMIGPVGQVGDLYLSYLKRCAGVKDTGTIIPGHGGLLDRLDSSLLVMPVFFYFEHSARFWGV